MMFADPGRMHAEPLGVERLVRYVWTKVLGERVLFS